MGLLDRLRGTPAATMTEAGAVAVDLVDPVTVQQLEATVELYQERFAELELQLEDWGWTRMVAEGDREFSRAGLDRIITLTRLLAIKNPLLRRSVRVGNFYIWGQGVEVTAEDETINGLVQAFLDNRGNQRALFGHEPRKQCEQALRTDGNLFLNLIPSRMTGEVAVRTIPVDEVREIITNPGDRSEPWFYLRRWNEVRLNETTGLADDIRLREAYYPDWTYEPRFRRPEIAGKPVMWDTPIMHVKVGGLMDMRFGVPELYAGGDWARAYNQFLEQVASMASSLSRFAFRMTSGRGKAADTARRLNTTVDPLSAHQEANPSPVAGATMVTSENVKLEAISKAGAMISGSEGKEIRLQVAAATDLPDTVLSGDPDQGNLATAKTLDRPTELAFMDRQELWAGVYRDLCNYAVDRAILSPLSPIAGTIARTGPTTVKVELPDETDRTVKVVFPPILEQDIAESMDAITAAFATGLVDDETILRLMLTLLGVENVDEELDKLEATKLEKLGGGTLGGLLADAFRKGQDPNALLRGQQPPTLRSTPPPPPTSTQPPVPPVPAA